MGDPVEFVRGKMNRLFPTPTGLEPQLIALEEIRLVVFDIYGTLIISAAGDISLVSEVESRRGMQEALKVLGLENGFAEVEEALLLYRKTIGQIQARLQKEGTEFPEVEIREVWQVVAGYPELEMSRLEEAALVYECFVNPCWEMPGASNVLALLARNQLPLGIISNAQFYTDAVVSGVSGISLEDGLFEQDLCVFSYREREAKPSATLFHKVSLAAQKRGMKEQEILYIGNDVSRDIVPAREVGFRTALFAGDERSLRTGSLGASEASALADVVLTDLSQLGEVLGLKE